MDDQAYLKSYIVCNGEMFHVLPQRGGPNTKLGDQATSKSHNLGFTITYCVEVLTVIG